MKNTAASQSQSQSQLQPENNVPETKAAILASGTDRSPAPSFRAVHFLMTNRGGCGKSFIGWALAQFLHDLHRQRRLVIIDTDERNQTLAQFKALQATAMPLTSNRSGGIERTQLMAFTTCLHQALQNRSDDIIVDVGASSAYARMRELLVQGMAATFQRHDYALIFHMPLTSTDIRDHVNCIEDLHDTFRFARIAVWVNDFFAETAVLPTGRTLRDLGVEHVDDRISVIQLTDFEHSFYGSEVKHVYRQHATFGELKIGYQLPDHALTAFDLDNLETCRHELHARISLLWEKLAQRMPLS